MNLMDMVVNELGVQRNKPFKVKMLTQRIYLMKITDKSIYIYLDGQWEKAKAIIYENLLNGNIEVVEEWKWLNI